MFEGPGYGAKKRGVRFVLHVFEGTGYGALKHVTMYLRPPHKLSWPPFGLFCAHRRRRQDLGVPQVMECNVALPPYYCEQAGFFGWQLAQVLSSFRAQEQAPLVRLTCSTALNDVTPIYVVAGPSR